MTTKDNNYLFHPLEISFCGHSGSGKTTLAKKLIEKFSCEKYSVGYIKHDAHKFEMDKEGKDTFIAGQAGASDVAISSIEKVALILDSFNHKFTLQQNFVDADMVLIEGYKDSLCRKILMWNDTAEDRALLDKYLSDSKFDLVAVVGSEKTGPTSEIPYFQRDNLESIHNFVKSFSIGMLSTEQSTVWF